MRIRLNGELLRSLIDEVGGVEAFLERWMHGTEAGEEDLSKATVYRWMKGQLPKNSPTLLQLSCVFDIDPFALLTIDDQDIVQVFDQLIEIVQKGSSKPAPLRLLRDFFGRRKDWPPETLARAYFKRSWHISEFRHDPDSGNNFYAFVKLEFSPVRMSLRPQVIHFASRYEQWYGGRWLHFGFVSRQGVAAKLSCINGFTQEIILKAVSDPTPVKLWLGPNPTIIRVASLHHFSLSPIQDCEGHETTLQFPG